MPATDSEPQRGRPFRPGHSGNPAGRPKGARNKASIIAEAKIEEKFGAVIDKLIERALDGNVSALRFCAGRVLPERPPVEISLAGVRTTEAALEVSEALFDAVAAGDLTAQEAQRMRAQLDAHMKLVQRDDTGGLMAELKASITQRVLEGLDVGQMAVVAGSDEWQDADLDVYSEIQQRRDDRDEAEPAAAPGEIVPDAVIERLDGKQKAVANPEIYSGKQRERPPETDSRPDVAADSGDARRSRPAFAFDETVLPSYVDMAGQAAVRTFGPAMAYRSR